MFDEGTHRAQEKPGKTDLTIQPLSEMSNRRAELTQRTRIGVVDRAANLRLTSILRGPLNVANQTFRQSFLYGLRLEEHWLN
ncbi:MAG: hypothetical protein KDA84_02035 [Planctomycetaceae bacterium]|nr:hypothetical protein [Planctomycetaceae bacterium]